jgi:hypothetical protein
MSLTVLRGFFVSLLGFFVSLLGLVVAGRLAHEQFVLFALMTGDVARIHPGDVKFFSWKMAAWLESLSSSSLTKKGASAVDWVFSFFVTVSSSSSLSLILLRLVKIGGVE